MGHARRGVALVVTVAILSVGTVFVLMLSSHAATFSCPAGNDNRASGCRDAVASCREDPSLHGNVGSADGDGFSYGWSCDQGALTSFTYTGANFTPTATPTQFVCNDMGPGDAVCNA